MSPEETVRNLTRLTQLYRGILNEEDTRLNAFLERSLEDVAESQTRENAFADEVRQLHARIREGLSASAPNSNGDLLSPLQQLRLDQGTRELRAAIRELQLTLQRNRRFVHHSLAFVEELTAAMFNRQPQGYDGKGNLQAGQGSGLRGGVKV